MKKTDYSILYPLCAQIMISLFLLCIQTIFEDGREIVTSSGLMSKDFTHGWNSSNYIFRVEVDGRLEHQYTFSIDGVPFIQMQRKQDIDRQHRNDRDNDRDSEERNNNNPSRYQKAPFAKNNPGQTSAGARLADSSSSVSPRPTMIDVLV